AIDSARTLLREINPQIREAVKSPFSASALVCASLLSDKADIATGQNDMIWRAMGERFLEETLRIERVLGGLPVHHRIPLLNLSVPALRELSRSQRQRLIGLVRSLIEADEKIDPFERIVSDTLQRNLLSMEAAGQGSRPNIRSVEALLSECQLVLSCLA